MLALFAAHTQVPGTGAWGQSARHRPSHTPKDHRPNSNTTNIAQPDAIVHACMCTHVRAHPACDQPKLPKKSCKPQTHTCTGGREGISFVVYNAWPPSQVGEHE
jgi:hypothetical protein